MKSAFLISATSSGCGKTTVSLGLMRALVRKYISVQPFKCGPDYIDTQFQSIAAERDSINLDLFMSSEQHVRAMFSHYSEDTVVSIVEGVMGMFDGFDKMKGSSADIARVLDIPVILLINAASTAYSVAATIYGFTRFCPDVKVAGVVFNRVASENHYSFLKNACEDVGVESFGYLKKNTALQMPSRHLGLTLSSRDVMNKFIDLAADEVEKNIDIDSLVEVTSRRGFPKEKLTVPVLQNLKVAVARDEAFCFIYPVNLNLFGKIIYFSPLHDQRLPEADLVYLPGGYPELFAKELSENFEMRNEIKAFAEKGGRILAECGGLIYLCDEIDGEKMCGVFPLKATMKDSKLSLGYRTIEFPHATLKGHEFHYSHIIDPLSIPGIATQQNAKGLKVDTPVYKYKNTIAGYTHLYWAETDILKLWE
jgi:cobyrinic acid a,c-diamide synthase